MNSTCVQKEKTGKMAEKNNMWFLFYAIGVKFLWVNLKIFNVLWQLHNFTARILLIGNRYDTIDVLNIFHFGKIFCFTKGYFINYFLLNFTDAWRYVFVNFVLDLWRFRFFSVSACTHTHTHHTIKYKPRWNVARSVRKTTRVYF